MMLDPKNLVLSHGSHGTREEGMCLMEAVAFMAGESHSDLPKCSCPVLAAYARTLNDHMGAGPEGDALRAKHLAPLASKLVGTRSTTGVERKRVYFFADRAVRLFAPLALGTAGLTERADALRSLPEIADAQTARVASAAAAWAADAAAYAAADAAAGAYAAADAAADAAAGAAYVAARAARAAAWAAARAAEAAAEAAWAARAAAKAADVDAAEAAAEAAGTWEQAAQVLAEACEINLEGENR